jgi:hypothetical protein
MLYERTFRCRGVRRREEGWSLDERFAEVAADDKALAEFLALEAKDYKGMYQQLAWLLPEHLG